MGSGILEWVGTSVIRSNYPDGQLEWNGVSVIRSDASDLELQYVSFSVIRSIESISQTRPRLNHRSFTMF